MTKLIVKILYQFRYCFNRKETFLWFALIVFGFLLRSDHRGVSSIIGTLGLNPDCYESILHFFRSKAYDLEVLKSNWINLVVNNIEIMKVDEKLLLVGDHIKVAKEGNYMPGVKKLHQESENINKPEYIYGHQFGMIGAITETKKAQCIPLNIELQDGKIEKESFDTIEVKQKINCIKRMAQMIEKVAMNSKISMIVILDAYFPSKTIFEKAKEINNKLGKETVSIVTRAKKNFTGYMKPEKPKVRKRGRPREYGDRVKLINVFSKMSDSFIETTIELYGKQEKIRYFHMDLLWKPIKSIVRFVFVKINDKEVIFMSSNLKLNPVDVIIAYSFRFKIEVSFKMLKHTLGGFWYHFWTKAMPKKDKKRTSPDYTVIKEKKDQRKILNTIRATEVFTFINCMVLGILMIISINHSDEVWSKFTGWLRTKSSHYPSPETVQNVLQKELIWNYQKVSEYAIFRKMKQYKNKNYEDLYKLTS